jgi:hypothetical protein
MRNWRSDKIEYSYLPAAAMEHVRRHYPGRFATLGDLGDATDAELLAVPLIGRAKLKAIRDTIKEATLMRRSPDGAFKEEFGD